MYRIVIFVMVCQPLTNAEGLRDLVLPWSTRFTRQIDSKQIEPAADNVCKLPPYPERGRYLSTDERGAGPGDVILANVSLVQYELDDSIDTLKISTMSCSYGKWSENEFRYESDKLYFDSSWCPMLCSNFENDNATASDSTKQYTERKENATANRICIIPPYPEGGGSYFHLYLPDVKPGDTFKNISLYHYTLDGSGVYEIKSLSCVKGVWFVRLFHRGTVLKIKKMVLCAIACTSSATKKPSVPHPTLNAQKLDSTYLPFRSTMAGSSDAGEPAEGLCELPPYPKRGKYFVVGAPDATPGDFYPNVSLVEYVNSENNESVSIKVQNCSSGKWTQTILQFAREEFYFNTSWCPLLCSSFETDNITESESKNVNGTDNTEENERTKANLCEIPPYPEHGGYYLHDEPTAGPGYIARSFLSLYRYVVDETNGTYELKKLVCNKGAWFVTVMEVESGLLYFKKRDWCPFLCPSSAAEKFSGSGPPKRAGVLSSPYVPWRSDFKERAAGNTTEKVRTELCELPPYPQNGSYMAVYPPDARPGDSVESVSLVQYTSMNDSHVEVRALNCSFGKWSESVFQSLSKSIYFDTAWCPYLCLPSDVDAASEGNNQTTKKTQSGILCKLPPYPAGGSYHVHDIQGAEPGDSFNEFVISQYFLDDDGKFYRIEELSCRNGTWSKTLFRTEGDKIFFNKKMWCPLLCRIFRNSST